MNRPAFGFAALAATVSYALQIALGFFALFEADSAAPQSGAVALAYRLVTAPLFFPSNVLWPSASANDPLIALNSLVAATLVYFAARETRSS